MTLRLLLDRRGPLEPLFDRTRRGSVAVGGTPGTSPATVPGLTILDGAEMPAAPNCVVIDGTNAFVGGNGFVATVDISDPSNMTVTDTLSSTPTLDALSHIAKSGDHLYAVSNTEDSVVSIDASDPANLAVADTITDAVLNGPQGIALSGAHAFVAASIADRLVAVDISTPSALAITSSIFSSTSLNLARRLAIVGTTAFVACSPRLAAVNISNPAAMSVISTEVLNFGGSGNSDGSDVIVVDNVAVVPSITGVGRVFTLDVSNSSNMTMQDYFTSGDAINTARNVAWWKDAMAVVTASSADSVFIIDFSDPTAITQLDWIQSNGSVPGPGGGSFLETAEGVAVSGDFAFVCAASDTQLTSLSLTVPA